MTDDMTLTGARVLATAVATDRIQLGVRFPLRGDERTDEPIASLGVDPSTGERSDGLTLGSTVTPDAALGVRWRDAWVSIEIGREQDALCVAVTCGEHSLELSLDGDELHRLREEFGWHRLAIEPAANYDAWFRAQRTSVAELADQRLAAASLPTRPLFSIIVPLYHTPLDFFLEMADSVLCQTYDNLELVLVNSTPADVELARAVSDLAAADERVRVVELESNLGITENTNAGIDVAKGDFVCFFDHDDIIEPDLLFHYATAIGADPKIDLLYCDEDKLEDGRYFFPTFKPDFSLQLLETNNYVCHMLTVRRELLRSLPTPTRVYDGAQDHRLGLVASEHLRHTFHARKMLYHWRVSETSTAGNSQAKPESLEAGRRAIQEHLDRIGVRAHVENVPMMAHCYVSLMNDDAGLPSCTLVLMGEGADASVGAPWELAGIGDVVDLRNLGDRCERIGAALDTARSSESDFVILSDALRPRPHVSDLLSRLLVVAERDEVGLTSGKAVLPDGTKCGGAYAFSDEGPVLVDRAMPEGDHQSRGFEIFPHEVDAVSGHFVVIRRELLLELGLDADLGGFWSVGLSLAARDRGLESVEVPMALVEVDAVREDLRLPVWDAALDASTTGVPASAGTDRLNLVRDRAVLRSRWPQVACAPSRYYSEIFDAFGYYGPGYGRAFL